MIVAITAVVVAVFIGATVATFVSIARDNRRFEAAAERGQAELDKAFADLRARKAAEAAYWRRLRTPQVDDRLRRAWGQADQQPDNVSTPAETRQAVSLLASVSTRREG